MGKNFRWMVIAVVVLGLGMGAAFGAGSVYGRNNAPKAAATTSSAAASFQGGGVSSSAAGAGDASARSGARGTVDGLSGDVLTVKAQDGSTTKVKLGTNTPIRKTVDGSADDLKAGVTVTVLGEKGSDGTVAATSIQIVSEGAAAGSGGSGRGR